jgi:NAD(P)-dependent dehydrogenase (short-subunit alcohol dehydrogenase family)
MAKLVILVTGASSGFGLMTARALAEAGHIVYASMRET